MDDISSMAQNLLTFTRFIRIEKTKNVPIKKKDTTTSISYLYQYTIQKNVAIHEIQGNNRSLCLYVEQSKLRIKIIFLKRYIIGG